jgi:hypothetical protein
VRRHADPGRWLVRIVRLLGWIFWLLRRIVGLFGWIFWFLRRIVRLLGGIFWFLGLFGRLIGLRRFIRWFVGHEWSAQLAESQ